jgi:small GTP-binding protein
MTLAVLQLSKKVCLLGDMSVGKTSLVRRYVEERFDDKYLSTLGVKVSRKEVDIQSPQGLTRLTILLWDLAGGLGNDAATLAPSYLRGAAGAVLVCDLTRAGTLDSVLSYARQLHAVSPSAVLLLAANKEDLADRHQVTSADVAQVAQALNTVSVPTSAKTGAGVETLFLTLGRLLVATSSEQ